MENKLIELFLTINESMLRAQLSVIQQFRRDLGLEPQKKKTNKGMSQIAMIYDILKDSKSPVHIDQLLLDVQKKFDVKLEKESVVSALTKRIKRNDRFIKTAPNTYFRIDQKDQGVKK